MPYFFGIPPLIWIVFGVMIGLIFGSFANVVVFRLPRGKSILRPGSHCTNCGNMLSILCLIPVISWLVLGGRCKYCRVKISLRYPVVEGVCALLFVGMIGHAPTLSAVPLSIFAFMLLCIAFIDGDTQEIPDSLLIISAVVGIVWLVMAHFAPMLFSTAPSWRDALLGILIGALPLFILDRITLLLLNKDGFGYGDVKLMAMAGLFLCWQNMLVAYFFAFIAGGMYAAFLLVTKRAKRSTYIAFGPFLCAGIIMALWWGQQFVAILFT